LQGAISAGQNPNREWRTRFSAALPKSVPGGPQEPAGSPALLPDNRAGQGANLAGAREALSASANETRHRRHRGAPWKDRARKGGLV